MDGEHTGKATISRIGQLCKVTTHTQTETLSQFTPKIYYRFFTSALSHGNNYMFMSELQKSIELSACLYHRMTWEATGVWWTSGPLSSRPGYCVQCPGSTASIHTLMSYVSVFCVFAREEKLTSQIRISALRILVLCLQRTCFSWAPRTQKIQLSTPYSPHPGTDLLMVNSTICLHRLEF